VSITGGWLLTLLADATPSPSPTSNEPDASLVSPGWLGFAFLAFLGVAVFLLWKSMNRQFKKIDFDEAATEKSPKHPKPTEPAPDAADLGATKPDDVGPVVSE
jgi:hypothetical protein